MEAQCLEQRTQSGFGQFVFKDMCIAVLVVCIYMNSKSHCTEGLALCLSAGVSVRMSRCRYLSAGVSNAQLLLVCLDCCS